MPDSISTFRQKARAWLEANVPAEPSPEDGPASRDFVLAWQKAQAAGGWAGIAWPQDVGGIRVDGGTGHMPGDLGLIVTHRFQQDESLMVANHRLVQHAIPVQIRRPIVVSDLLDGQHAVLDAGGVPEHSYRTEPVALRAALNLEVGLVTTRPLGV